MAQDIVSGLFGPQPWQIDQARQEAIASAADKYAAQTPMQQGLGMLYRAGAGLGQIGGGMLGLQDPAAVEAQQRRAALEGLDITSPEALLQRAQQVQDPQMRMRLMLMADQKKKELETANAAAVKMRLDEARAKRELALAEKAARGEPEMKYAPEIAKLLALRDSLPQGDPRRKVLDAAIAKATYIKPDGVNVGKAPSGFRFTATGDLEAIPGGPADLKTTQAQLDKEDAARSTIDLFDAIRRNIEVLYDPTNKRLKPNATSIFGSLDQYRPDLALSQGAVDADAALTTLKDQLTMLNLADAKKRVGQSFGSMQVKEWDKFTRQLSSLDRRQSEKTAANSLEYVLKFINEKSDVLRAALGAAPNNSGEKAWEAKTPQDVRALYKAGTINRETAKAVLKEMGVPE